MSNLVLGHKVPAERWPGWRFDPENLYMLCRSCNASQANRTPEEWRAARSGRLVDLGLVAAPERPSLYGRRRPAYGRSAVITADYTRRTP